MKQYNCLHRSLYTILTLSLLLLGACTADRKPNSQPPHREIQEGEPFTVEMGGFGSHSVASDLRATDVTIQSYADIQSLRLLVFDEEGKFLYTREAVLEGAEVVSSKPDGDFLPLHERKGIEQAKKFKVTLIKSSKPRRIHFIANYDWTGFNQDYFLMGASEGGLISALQTTRPNFTPLWAYLTPSTLDEHTLGGKVIVLLRTYAQISIDASEASKFSPTFGALNVTRFTVCNYPERGTLAPFVYTSEHKYEFRYKNPEATMIPNVNRIKGGTVADLIPVSQPFHLHEWDNKDHNLFVIIEGQRTDKKREDLGTRYYKLDIVSLREDGTKEFIPILRNYQYKVQIEKVLSDGYDDIEKALKAPAGNNIFASVELNDYPSVSDGEIFLDVSPLITYAVSSPTDLSFKVVTSDPKKDFTYIPRWEESNDPYMGTLTKTSDGFKVHVKDRPTDGSYKEYTVDVVLRGSKGTIVTRSVKITLRPPFEFNASLKDDMYYDSATDTRKQCKTLTFDLNRYLNAGILPFEILIEASNLTPVNDDPDNKLLLEFRDKKIYYKYTLRDPSKLGQRVSLHFTENRPRVETYLILSSKYHRQVRVNPQ